MNFIFAFAILIQGCSNNEVENMSIEYVNKISNGDDTYIELLTNDKRLGSSKKVIEILIDKWRNDVQNKGGLKSLSVNKTKFSEDGNTAEVTLDLEYGNKTQGSYTVDLEKEDNRWKVSFLFYLNN